MTSAASTGRADPATTSLDISRPRLGGGLLAFGVIGLVLLSAAGILVFASLGSVDAAVTGLARQRAELVAMIEPASAALTRAADSAEHASASLTTTSEAAERGATLATSLADSFDRLAGLGSFDLLGTRPFAALSQDFARVGSDARLLAANLTSVGSSMRTNVADSSAVAAELRALAGRLDALGHSGATNTTDDEPVAAIAGQLTIARLVLLGLPAWLAVPAIASTWIGWRLLRGSQIRG